MTPPRPRPPTPHHRRAVLLSGAAWLLAGCASRPPPELLSLPLSAAAPDAAAAVPPPGDTPVLIVRRVALPEYLLSRRVRYRADASTLAEWPDTVWAERIEVAASRELLAGLRAALPGWTVCEPGCAGMAAGARWVSLRFELESMDFMRSLGRLQSRALLTLDTTGQAPRQWVLQREVVASGDTPQGHALAIAELLQGLAQSAAAAVKGLPAGAAPNATAKVPA
jgi:uncharacterized lipoprotein YmbA